MVVNDDLAWGAGEGGKRRKKISITIRKSLNWILIEIRDKSI